ncbi:hypothetical protein EPUL_005991, partial [Erysiphe pulchra]
MNTNITSELDPESEVESESEIDKFPPLPSNPTLKRTSEILSPTQGSDYKKDTLKDDQHSQNSTLMMKARGLLNLVGPFLEEMETDRPGAGAGFLALISEGVSRAIRGEKISLRTSTDTNIMPNSSANNDNSCAARIQRIIPHPSLMADAMQVPSGIVILSPLPAKAAAILQYKDMIAQRFGKAIVERQVSWTVFILGLLPKQANTLDGKDPLDELLLQESGLVFIRDE